ncbi:MAG: hypothetical protein KAS18_08625 [Calditrichia bacterium]|nr:hypothetical protein [Calditrichia bacterium]
MPVYKYRTFDDAKKSQWVFNTDAAYFNSVQELFKIAYRLNPVKYPRGVFLYKTFTDANKQRFQWEVKHAIKKNKSNRKMEKVLHKFDSFQNQEIQDIKYWQNLSGEKKLEILEYIRSNYWEKNNGTPQRLQRIYRIVERT